MDDAGRELFSMTPLNMGPGAVAAGLAGLVRDGGDARVLWWLAYSHTRGWLTHVTVPCPLFERVFALLARWSDTEALGEVKIQIETIRGQLSAWRSTGGFGAVGGMSRMLSVSQQFVMGLYLVGATYLAVRRRLRELAVPEASESEQRGVGGGEQTAAAAPAPLLKQSIETTGQGV